MYHLTVFYCNIADVPEYKRHRTAWQGGCLFSVIPGIAIPEDASRPIAVNVNAISRDDKTGMVILKSYWIRIVAPVVQVVRHLNYVSLMSHMRYRSRFSRKVERYIVDE